MRAEEGIYRTLAFLEAKPICFQVVRATHPACRLASRLDGRQEQRDQEPMITIPDLDSVNPAQDGRLRYVGSMSPTRGRHCSRGGIPIGDMI